MRTEMTTPIIVAFSTGSIRRQDLFLYLYQVLACRPLWLWGLFEVRPLVDQHYLKLIFVKQTYA